MCKPMQVFCTLLFLQPFLVGCGGGSSGVGGSASSGGTEIAGSNDPTYTAGVYLNPSNFQNKCAVVRQGTDPITHVAYPDQPGSIVWENSWLRAWENAYYLWYSQLPDLNPSSYSTTASYFSADKTQALTSSGTPVDKFHFTYTTAQWESLSQAGTSVDYGVHWVIIQPSAPRQIVIGYVDPNTPGSAAQLNRGASIIKIDGIDAVNATDQTSVNALNAALAPTTLGETHTFTVLDTANATPRDVVLQAATVVSQSVMNVKALNSNGRTVGYFQFNDHLATAELALKNAITTLQSSSISDLIIDMRYNGGGLLDIASELSFMIAGPSQTAGKTFEKTVFNDKYPTTDPITGQVITPIGFYSTAHGYSIANGQSLPSLNLSRVFVITGSDTCSASESVINSLRGIGVNVIMIGGQTCGKPYGFYPQDNCGTTYFSIEFKGVNNQGFGDYTDGFIPSNAPANSSGVPVPGCLVSDDFAHALGDPNEQRLAAALAYVSNGTSSCPSPSALSNPTLHQAIPRMLKPVWLTNRILHQERP